MRQVLILILSIVFAPFTVTAQTSEIPKSMDTVSIVEELKAAPKNQIASIMDKRYLSYQASDNVTNQIPYFDNRFRIDAQLDEITLIFYRKSGTPPIILVRPDGSKYKVSNHPEDKVKWYDDRTFDMIRIKKPMPGPWQAIGDILPESKIMVVTDVVIDVVPMPEIVLSGETLKMTGRLVNGQELIDDPLFREVVTLDVDFFSTNNPDYDNFGAEPVRLNKFRDDGEDLDEYANDGVFTGEFKLSFASGEWLPIYLVQLPMLTRELKQKTILLQKNPITIQVDTASNSSAEHVMSFHIDPSYVDPDSVLFQGQITLPDRTKQPFSIMEGSGIKRVENFPYIESGLHRINVNVFGKMKSGREFVLSVPEFTFNVERGEDEVVASIQYGASEQKEEVSEEDSERAKEELLAQALLVQEKAANEKQQATIIKIIVANLIILVGAVGGILIYRQRKKK